MNTMQITHSDGRIEVVTDVTYLGDGLYGWYDGFNFWLGAPRETGWECVALEPATLYSFIRWLKQKGIEL